MATFSQAVMLPPQNGDGGSGTMLLPDLAPLGDVLAAAANNTASSVEACSHACRQDARCNTFWYCNNKNGCVSSSYNLTSPVHGCQLVQQQVTKPGTGRPVLVVAAPGFTGGAPLRYDAPAIEGFDVYPGLGFWYRYDLQCNDSVSQPGSCGLLGSPQQHAARCQAEPLCQVIMYFPEGRDYPGPGQPVVLLKGGYNVELDVQDANINLNAVLYQRKVPPAPGAGDTHGAAIAGIAGGAAAAAALLLAAAVLVVRRRRQRRAGHDLATAERTGTIATGAGSRSAGAVCHKPPAHDPPELGTASASSQGGSSLEDQGDLEAGSRQLAGTWSAPPSVPSGTLSLAPSSSGMAVLPPGIQLSISAAVQGVPPARGRAGVAYPPAPLPSLASSFAARRQPGFGSHLGSSPLQGASPAPSPPTGGVPSVPSTAGAAYRRPSPPGGAHPLLSHLPTYGWQRSIVDYSAIQFVLLPDGAYHELGSGASATVYKVLLNGVDPHAAKVFRIGTDPTAQLQFVEEAGLLRTLRHRCVVGFAGVCVADGNGLILMELMEGGDLRTRNREVDERGRRVFGWHQRGRRVALDVACALHYLHASTYTHFDVKARNVLLSRDLTAKLADVGFARAMRATHHSVEGPTGTFDYMAPELLTGRRCNSAVDVYSFGVLLWEVVTGLRPVRGSMREPRVPEECPAAVAVLIAECLQEEPAQRPTAAQLVERLGRLQ